MTWWNAGSRFRFITTGERNTMVHLTRLNGSKIVINADLIEFIEELPDTIVTLSTGQKIMVNESAEDIIEKVKEYKRAIFSRPITGE